MGDRRATLTAVLIDAVSGPAKTIRAEISGIGSEVGKVSSILQGVGQGIGQALASGFSDVIRSVTSALPNLLDQGHSYLDLLQQIELETGMTAEQTSSLVGTMRALGVPTDDITTLLARLATNLATNEGKFRALGIATRDSKGELLGAYAVIENTRTAIAEHGAGLLSTAAAQELFGRSGHKLIEFFTATPAEVAKAADSVRRWGGIVDDATVKNADRLGDTIESFKQGITDIGVNIAAAVDPYLRAFVDSFASFVQAHLNEIVNFAVGVVNAVTGFVSGLFGITSATDVLTTTTDAAKASAGGASDAYKKWAADQFKSAQQSDGFVASLNAQIKAIDAHAHALEVASERRRASRQREQLADSLAAAQAQLRDLRGNAPFTEGLSNAESQLAIQKHAQDVIDAEKDVADKRAAIGDFEADQKDRAERELLNRQKTRLQDLLTVTKANNKAILDSGLQQAAGLEQGVGGAIEKIGLKTQEFAITAKASFQAGVDAARGFLDVLLGTEHVLGAGQGTYRTGGVIGALGTLGGAVAGLGVVVGRVAAFIGDIVRDIGRILPTPDKLPGDQGFDLGKFLFGNAYTDKNGNFNLGGFLFGMGSTGLASGGIVPATPGGRMIRVAEGGESEAIIPLSQLGRRGAGPAGNTYHLHFDMLTVPTKDQIRSVARALFDDIDELMGVKADNVPVGMPYFGRR